MFVARSAARVRVVRLVFLLAGLAPTAAIVGWAIHLRGDGHRREIERRWQAATGLPLTVAAVEHPRPGVVRGRGCVVPAADGGRAFELPVIEVESSADEDRVRLGRFSCDVRGAVVLAGLAREWLGDEVRFGRTCIVEVADSRWGDDRRPDDDAEAVPLRVECVARPGTRAMRVVRQASGIHDEVRIVRDLVTVDEAAGDAPRGGDTVSITAECRLPIPLAALVLAAGADATAATACGAAVVSGTLEASRDASGWSGSARGTVATIDLAAAAAAIGGRADGTAEVEVRRLAWAGGRVTAALLECAAGAGTIDGRLFDRVVLALAARPGPAARPLPAGGERPFDAAACVVEVGRQGVRLTSSPRLPAGLAVHAGGVLLAAPAAMVPGDRVAWMLSAPGTAYAPAMGPGAWLISVLPSESAAPAAADERRF